MKVLAKTIVPLAVVLLCMPVGALGYNFFEAWPSNTESPPGTSIDIQPIPIGHFWFSTEIGFTATGSGSFVPVSDGDLLSDRWCVVRTNYQLTARLGIMPMVPDLGLDAVTLPRWPTPYEDVAPEDAEVSRAILFSLEESVWSETLGWLGHGYLLSSAGQIERTEWDLIHRFEPDAIPISGVGLDAVHRPVNPSSVDTGYLFSVEIGFYSNALNRYISPGDLLAEGGFVYRSQADLMANFNPFDPPFLGDPDDPELVDDGDFGLDAVWMTRNGTVWFSVEEGFYDENWGYISDGDVLCECGMVVRRNLALLNVCSPLEDCSNFGLDALHFIPWAIPIPMEEVELEPLVP